ncbi:hypothetical protein DO97_18255 [Neosynechococcus sphagnicola sy1]|uniref:Uncharacterized protein n=1 Tax=Neosynechococcus sphagnicola sy1 TaxID=1497020 RepID=A0A098TMC2_9CYAN|nr:hypothetical protein [Neosynechococcus sphagnicola]KGF73465.1 hypothetical protein DO97_18255 [Neosynechococcus sphagnicola sy1]
MKTIQAFVGHSLTALLLTAGLGLSTGSLIALGSSSAGSPAPANGTSGPYTASRYGSPAPANGTSGPYTA